MSKPIIEVKGISKRYLLGSIGATRLRDDVERIWHRLTGKAERQDSKDFWALRDVSFDVQPGEIVGIIGRNGAGKSTLLKVLSRITEPTTGEIVLRGRVASLLEVGTGFHPDLTGRENVFLNGAILGMTKAEIRSKLDEIIAFAEIEKFIDTPVKRYSSGMYVRLAFAVAAHLEPEILIIDEVLAVGDQQFQNKCIGKMQDVSRSGRTVLFVSHNMAAIRRLCTYGVILKAGQVTCAAPIQESLAHYGQSLFTSREEMPDEQGRTLVKITDVSLYVRGIKADAAATGEPLSIRIKAEISPTVTEDLKIGLALENMNGVFTLINYSHFHAVRFRPETGTFSATIDKLPLAEGLYRVHLRILSGDKEIFWSTGLKNIQIEGGDFYGTGIRGEESLCPWLLGVEWEQTQA
jgi:lipopolysaccharide transport system ATP-binding protein